MPSMFHCCASTFRWVALCFWFLKFVKQISTNLWPKQSERKLCHLPQQMFNSFLKDVTNWHQGPRTCQGSKDGCGHTKLITTLYSPFQSFQKDITVLISMPWNNSSESKIGVATQRYFNPPKPGQKSRNLCIWLPCTRNSTVLTSHIISFLERNFYIKTSATSQSDVQCIESLWTVRHYVMRPTKSACSKRNG